MMNLLKNTPSLPIDWLWLQLKISLRWVAKPSSQSVKIQHVRPSFAFDRLASSSARIFYIHRGLAAKTQCADERELKDKRTIDRATIKSIATPTSFDAENMILAPRRRVDRIRDFTTHQSWFGTGNPRVSAARSQPSVCAIAQSFLNERLRSPRSTPPM